MEYEIVPFSKVPGGLWDKWVSRISDATYLHSAKFLAFLHAMMPPDSVFTFACIDGKGDAVALCPLAISKNNIAGMEFHEASWKGAPLGMPAFRKMDPGQARKARREVFEYYHRVIKDHDGKRCYLRKHAVSLNMLSGIDTTASQFAILQEGYEPHVQNTAVIDMRLSEEELAENLSKYHRRHMKRSQRDGLVVVEYDGQAEGLQEVFESYKAAHIKAAGGKVRPNTTYDMMFDYIEQGAARLFVVLLGKEPLGFLYCGEFHHFAFGWSQVNIKEFEKQYSPRHLLEWEAIRSYKRRNFNFYEIGTLWFGPQIYKVPTPKELSISEFKRRYGGVLFPEIFFEKIFDEALKKHIYRHRVDGFLSAGHCT